MLHHTLFFLMWWIPLISSSTLIDSNSQKYDFTFDDDDDSSTPTPTSSPTPTPTSSPTPIPTPASSPTPKPQIVLGAFRLIVKPTTAPLNTSTLDSDELLLFVQSIMLDSLKTSYSVDSVIISSFNSEITNVARTKIKRVNGDNIRDLSNLGVTLFFENNSIPSEEILMNRVKTAVGSCNDNGPITVGEVDIEEIILLWDGEHYIDPAVAPSSRPTLRPSNSPSQTLHNIRAGAPDIVLDQTKGNSLMQIAVGLGALLLFGGGFFLKRHRDKNTEDEEPDLGRPPSEDQGLHFLYHVPRETKVEDIKEVILEPEDSYSDLSSRSGRKVENTEHLWMNHKKRQYIMDDHVPSVLLTNSKNHPYSSDTSSSNPRFSTNNESSLLYTSARNSDFSLSTRSCFGPDSNWDTNDDTPESEKYDNGVEGFSASRLVGTVLKELDKNMLNRLDSFRDHNSKLYKDELSSDGGLRSVT